MHKILILFLLLCSCKSNPRSNDNKKNESQLVNVSSEYNYEMSDATLSIFLMHFVNVAKSRDKALLEKESTKIINDNNKETPFEIFFDKSFSRVFDSALLMKLSNTDSLEYSSSDMELEYFPKEIQGQLKGNRISTLREVNITKERHELFIKLVILAFVETKEGFKFFGYRTIENTMRPIE
ncbi:MAG: hypothetical protein E6H07_04275 [Bacteroidetes bacterium]|nr:MAG: hypothetical protein E6H07_04275 [Bacteroidota bacterium]